VLDRRPQIERMLCDLIPIRRELDSPGDSRISSAVIQVLDGASRAEAAKIGGMDRQTLRDWVIRFNDQGRAASSILRRRALRPS
jgi:transposase